MFFLPNAQLRTHSLSYLQFVVNSEIKLKLHHRQKREIKNYQHLHEQVTSDSCDSEDHVCTSFSRECLASAVTTATRWCPLSRLITDHDCQPWLATFSFSPILTSFLSLSFFLSILPPNCPPWVPSGGDQTNHWSLLATSPPANPPTTTSGRGHAPEKLVINAKKIVEIAFEIY